MANRNLEDSTSLPDILADYQPLDSDLTTIAGLTATTDNFIVSVASAWASRTPAQVRTTLSLVPGTNVQAQDATLTALAAYNTNGLLTQTAADTFVGRTLAGTSNRLTVTNGDGVAGAPTFDISSSYVGQASITTLGTVATGTWQGTAVAPGFGGTGLATYAVGDLLYASGATTLAKLADVATGNVLISGGVTTAPAWGQVGLTTHVTGILPSANGGTGVNNAGSLTLATSAAITGGGTLALGGFTLTVPATGSAALLATANVFSAAQAIAINDAGTNTTTTLATFTHNSSGTPAASFGSRLLFNLDSATVDDRNAAAIDAIWTTATDASRASAMVFSTVSAGGSLTEMFRVSPTTVTVPAANGITFGSGTSAVVSVTSSFLRMQATSGIGVSLYAGNIEKVRLLATGTGNLGVGHLTPATQLHVATTDAVTNAVTNVFTVGHNSSGTPAAGFGVGVLTQLDSSTTDDTTAADEMTTWVVATHASRTARRVFNIYDTASREAIRMEASGSAPMIGFLGAAAIARQTVAADATDLATAIALVNDIKAKLSAAASGFGLFT